MTDRMQAAIEIARSGGALGREYFERLETLEIEDKGPQDFVSQADRAVEEHVRALIAEAFPEDGIVGEEADDKPSRSGFTWVIDPIDGTANFISGIPVWGVVLAGVRDDRVEIGVIHDPVHDELFAAERGRGATLNGRPMVCPQDRTMSRGTIGTGYAKRRPREEIVAVISEVLAQDGVFHRNASGALSLAYVAAGRLNGYIEGHMHAWDCLAGQLLVAEAGGLIEAQSADAMIARGGRVVAASTGIFDTLVSIADRCYAP